MERERETLNQRIHYFRYELVNVYLKINLFIFSIRSLSRHPPSRATSDTRDHIIGYCGVYEKAVLKGLSRV